MNLKKHLLLPCIALCTAAILLTACSKQEAATSLYQYASSESALIMRIDLSDVLDNAGCVVTGQSISVSDNVAAMLNLSSDNGDIARNLASLRGVDLSNVVTVASNDGLVITLPITSYDSFKYWVEDVCGTSETTKYGLCYPFGRGFSLIIGNDGYCRIVGQSDAVGAVSSLNKFTSAASEHPLNDWKLSALQESDADIIVMGIAFDIEALYESIPGLKYVDAKADNTITTLDLDGSAAVLKAKLYDKQGNQITVSDATPCDPAVLAFARPDDELVAIMNMNGNSYAQSRIIKDLIPFLSIDDEILKFVDNTLVLAVDKVTIDDMLLFPYGFHYVLAFNYDPKCEQELKEYVSREGVAINYEVTFDADNHLFAFGNKCRPVIHYDSPAEFPDAFLNSFYAIQLHEKEGAQLLKVLSVYDLAVEASATLNADEFSVTCQFPGNAGGFLAVVINEILKQIR